jgi:AraC-like DNA-binding protein
MGGGQRKDAEREAGRGTGPLVARLLHALEQVADAAGPAPAAFARIAGGRTATAEQGALARPRLSVTLAGAQEARTADGSGRARAGQALLLPARVPVERTFSPAPCAQGWRALELDIPAEVVVRAPLAESVFGSAAGAGPAVLDAGPAALEKLIQLCEAVGEPETHPWMLQHQLEGVLLAFALPADAPSAARARFDVLLAIRQLVRARPADDFSVDALARRLGFSAATLRRRLARQGTSLRRLLREERMRIARVLLGDGRLNVAEVAIRCGYESRAKFSRRFRDAMGVPPSRFRRDPGER